MKMEDIASMKAADLAVSPEVFQQLGTITRLLHDTMQQLGVMPKLQTATEGLPDARSRLSYIATKTATAAEKVLNLVDKAKAEHNAISESTRAIGAQIVADPVKAVASGAVMNFVNEVESRLPGLLNQGLDAIQQYIGIGEVIARYVVEAHIAEAAFLPVAAVSEHHFVPTKI